MAGLILQIHLYFRTGEVVHIKRDKRLRIMFIFMIYKLSVDLISRFKARRLFNVNAKEFGGLDGIMYWGENSTTRTETRKFIICLLD